MSDLAKTPGTPTEKPATEKPAAAAPEAGPSAAAPAPAIDPRLLVREEGFKGYWSEFTRKVRGGEPAPCRSWSA